MIGPSAPVRTRRSRTTLTIAVVVSQLAALLTLLVTTAPPAAAAPACGTGATAGAINLTPLSNTGIVTFPPSPALPAAPAGTVWYQDASIAPAINSHYIGYKVTNLTGAAVNGYWVKVDGFSAASGTSFLGLATGETGTDQLGNLANGSNDNSYFYLTSGWTGASGQPSFAAGVNTSQMHVVHVYDRRPDLAGAVEVCSTTYGFSNMVNTLQAAANKVNNTVATANPPTIGSLMTMTVWGETGTLGSGQPNDPRRFDMSPATYGTWPVGTFRLEKVQVDLDLTTASPTAPAGTKNCDNNPVNGQPIPSPGPTNLDYLTYQFSATASASRCYLAVYTFRIIGTTSGTTAVSPVQEIASGTQTKHTNIDSAYASIAPIAIPENTLTLSKSASPTLLTAAGGTTTYSVTLNASNCITSTPCPATAQVDSLVDVLPAGTSYVPGTATFNGSAIADPVISGQTLTWVGPWVTPQPGSRTFTYQVTIPAGASQQYVNSATAPIGTVQIDTTLSLADNAPATATVRTRPAVANDSYSTTAGQTLTVAAAGVLANDSGSSLTVATNTNPASGTLTQNANGSLTYVPAAGFSGIVTYTYNVTDVYGNAAPSAATVTIVVNPDAIDDSYSTSANTALTVNAASGLLANDKGTGTGLSVTAVGTPSSGSVSVNGDGSFTYTPATNFTGNATFTYTACLPPPNGTMCDTATATIVVGLPAAPVASNDSYTVTAGGTLTVAAPGVLGNDTGTGITVTANTSPASGSLTQNANGSLTYTPAAGFSGVVTYGYTITDGFTRTSSATVTIVVGPDAVDDTGTTTAGTPLTASVAGNDTFAVGSTFAKATNPANGTASVTSGGSYTYTPSAGFFGVDSFTYTLCLPAPNASTCDTATVTVTVKPDAVDDAVTTPSGTTLNGTVTGNDLYPGGSTFSKATNPTSGSATVNSDGTFSYTPNPGFFGTDSFTYTVCLPSPNQTICDTATVTVTVGPDAVDDAFTSYGSGSFSSTVVGNDVFPVGSTFAKASNPASGTATVNSNGTFTYTPNAGFFGVDSFTYTLCLPSPNQAVCDTATVTITVAPDAVNDSASVTAGQTLNATVAGNDAYPAGSTFTKATDPAHGSVTVNSDGTYSYTPAPGFSGTDSFTYTVCLPSPNQTICDTATVTITVSPDAVDDAYSAVAGGTLTVAAPGVRSNDVGTNTTVAVLATTANGSLTLNADGSFTYAPNAGFSGTDTFTYTLTGDGGSDTATVTITVAPDAVNDSYSTPFNTTLTVSAASGVLANDHATGGSVAVLSTTSNGTLTLNADGSFTYVPNAGFNGTDTFTYTLTADGGTDTATATISVGLPAAPVAVDDSGSTAAGQALTVTAPGVLANDTGTSITVTSSTNPTHGTAAVNADGSYTYTPNAGFSGTDTFTYTITDAYGRTDTATVTITVTPVATDDTYNATTGQTLTVTAPGVLTNDLGTTKTVAVLATTSNGTLSLNADGSFSYTPGNGFSGTDSFTYTLTADGGTDTATVTIDVDPDAVDDSYTTLAGQTLVVPVGTGVLSNDLGTNLSVTANTNPAGGTVSVNPDGSFTYTPNPGFSGTDTFSYAACMPPPNGGRCAVATVSILVDNPPVATTDIVGNANANATTTVNLLPNDTDPDNDPLAVVSVTQPTSGGTVTKVGNTAQYKPPFNFTGYDVFTYTITDGHGGFSTATVHVRIGPTGLVYNDKYYPISIGGTTVNPTPGTPTPGTYDRIALTGSTRFTNQVLVVTLRDGFVPQLGDTFDVWTATSVTGAFAVVQGTVLPDGKVFDVQYLNDRVRLVVVGGIEVDSTADAVDANPADGICAAASGRCTLRAATQEANARAGQQAILTAPLGTYTLAIAGAGEDASATGDLDLTGPTTWYAQRATLDAALLDRGVHVLSGATLNATQLTVTNGRALSGPVPGAGAIFVEGASVVLSDVNLSGNSGQVGGALGTVSGQTLLNRGVITGNSATTSGGGLALFGPTVLDGVAVIGNTSGTFGGGMSVGGGGAVTVINAAVKTNSAPYGGGIVTGAPGTTAITQSVVQGNTASILGGGVAASGTVTLTDARVTGNAAPQGGGLYNGATGAATMTATRVTFDGNTGSTRGGAVANAGTLTIATSTLSGNVAGDGSGLAQLSGGASAPVATVTSSTITRGSSSGTGAGALLSQAGTVTVTNSIVADQLTGASCSATKVGIVSTGYDHASDATCGFTAVGDVQTGSALLGALGTNGGYSPTHKPLAGSPVINTGAASCGATDQRNWLRPRGGACEKGAIEV